MEQQWAKHPPDPYQIINNIISRVDGAMGHPAVFHNPEEVIRLMRGIQSEWSMMEQMSAPRRRSRVHGMDHYYFCVVFFMTFCWFWL